MATSHQPLALAPTHLVLDVDCPTRGLGLRFFLPDELKKLGIGVVFLNSQKVSDQATSLVVKHIAQWYT